MQFGYMTVCCSQLSVARTKQIGANRHLTLNTNLTRISDRYRSYKCNLLELIIFLRAKATLALLGSFGLFALGDFIVLLFNLFTMSVPGGCYSRNAWYARN